MSKLSRDQVLKLAKLSRLKLTDDEVEKFQKELSEILEYVERLENVDTEGLEPTYQVSGLTDVYRSDQNKELKAKPEDLLSILPEEQDGYIKVGKMI